MNICMSNVCFKPNFINKTNISRSFGRFKTVFTILSDLTYGLRPDLKNATIRRMYSSRSQKKNSSLRTVLESKYVVRLL